MLIGPISQKILTINGAKLIFCAVLRVLKHTNWLICLTEWLMSLFLVMTVWAIEAVIMALSHYEKQKSYMKRLSEKGVKTFKFQIHDDLRDELENLNEEHATLAPFMRDILARYCVWKKTESDQLSFEAFLSKMEALEDAEKAQMEKEKRPRGRPKLSS